MEYELKAHHSVVELLNTYVEDKEEYLEEGTVYGIVVLSNKIYKSNMVQLEKLWEKRKKYEKSEFVMRANNIVQFKPSSAIFQRFLGEHSKKRAKKGYRGSRDYLIEKMILKPSEVLGKEYLKYKFDIDENLFTETNVVSLETMKWTLDEVFTTIDMDSILNKNRFDKLMLKRMSSPIGNYKYLRVQYMPTDRVARQLLPTDIVSNCQRTFISEELQKLRKLNSALERDRFVAHKSLKVGRQYTELANTKKINRSLFYDSYHGEQMIEVDYHALHPMIMASELKPFFEDGLQWAMDKKFLWSSSNKTTLNFLLKSVFSQEQIQDIIGAKRFLENHKILTNSIKTKYQVSDYEENYQNYFYNEYKEVFEFSDDFYSDLLKILGVSSNNEFQVKRSDIKVCVLQLLHGQQWRGDIYSPLSKDQPINILDVDDESIQDTIWDMTEGITELSWKLFYQAFCSRFPILALSISYLQYCISTKDKDSIIGNKYLGFSRSLFYQEVKLIKEVVKYLKCNLSNKTHTNKRSLFEQLELGSWDGSSYAMFPIYDCVSVSKPIVNETKRIMETIALKEGFKIRADIKSPKIVLDTSDFPPALKLQIKPKKRNARLFETPELITVHLNAIESYKSTKKYFNFQYKKRNQSIRLGSKDDLFVVLKKIESKLNLLGYFSPLMAFIRCEINPIWTTPIGAESVEAKRRDLIVEGRYNFIHFRSTYFPYIVI